MKPETVREIEDVRRDAKPVALGAVVGGRGQRVQTLTGGHFAVQEFEQNDPGDVACYKAPPP